MCVQMHAHCSMLISMLQWACICAHILTKEEDDKAHSIEKNMDFCGA
jgi:hypothetical protein